jgi:hypothetical protein
MFLLLILIFNCWIEYAALRQTYLPLCQFPWLALSSLAYPFLLRLAKLFESLKH